MACFCLILSKFYYQAYCSQTFSTKILAKSEIVTYYTRQEALVVSHCQSQSGMFKVNFWQIFTVYRALGKFLAAKVSRNETFLQFCCHGGSPPRISDRCTEATCGRMSPQGVDMRGGLPPWQQNCRNVSFRDTFIAKNCPMHD